MGQRHYTVEYRANAVALAQEMGASAAARQLEIPSDTLYTWVSRAKRGELPMSPMAPEAKESLGLAQRVKDLERELRALRSENVEIRKENKILEEAAAFFAARRKKLGRD